MHCWFIVGVGAMTVSNPHMIGWGGMLRHDVQDVIEQSDLLKPSSLAKLSRSLARVSGAVGYKNLVMSLMVAKNKQVQDRIADQKVEGVLQLKSKVENIIAEAATQMDVEEETNLDSASPGFKVVYDNFCLLKEVVEALVQLPADERSKHAELRVQMLRLKDSFEDG